MGELMAPLRRRGDAALAALEACLDERTEKLSEAVAEAVRRLVALRDDLIERRRAGDGAAEVKDWLARTNAILSSVVGAEFPIKGLHRERIEQAAGALKAMLAAA
ncbi:MAG TPA: hypothetical protein VFA50_11880 [Stellaceae bacterium]|nr:hypothetical protein [Stellaceae bacterium]